jgi:pimeloyl-ACP methyl ester carboxylesterase
VGPGPHPGIVVVHGSGSSGRYQWEYRGLGPMFARMGIAALVYDKRAEEASFEALAADAAAAHTCLARAAGIDRRRVGFFGTSQGGWLAPLAATRAKDPAFLVLEKGAAVSVAEQEAHRVAYTMRAEGFGEDEVAEALAYTDTMFRAVEGEASWEAVASFVSRIRERTWAEHVQLASSPQDLEGWRRQRFDPAPVLRRTRVPVLAIFGEEDTLVPPRENADKMRAYLRQAGNDDVTVVVLPGEGHNRYRGQRLAGDRWAWPEAFWIWDRVSPREVRTIQAWLLAHLE